METELIKLKVKKQSSQGDNYLKIKQTFINACEQLDTSIFEPGSLSRVKFKKKANFIN